MPRHWDKGIDGLWEGYRTGSLLAKWSNKRGWLINHPEGDGQENWFQSCSSEMQDVELAFLSKSSGLTNAWFQVEVKAFHPQYKLLQARVANQPIEKIYRAHCLKCVSVKGVSLFQLITKARGLMAGKRGFWVEVRIFGGGQPIQNQGKPVRCMTRADEMALLLAIHGPLPLDAFARGLCCSRSSVAGALGTLIQRKVAKRIGNDVIPLMDRVEIGIYISRNGRNKIPRWMAVILESPEIAKSRTFKPC